MLRHTCIAMRFTPLAIQLFSMGASLFCVVFSIFSLIDLNPARVVVNFYVLAFGILTCIADVYCLPFFGYMKFIYTRKAFPLITAVVLSVLLRNLTNVYLLALGRGLLFLLIGSVMIQKGLFNIISGVILIVVGAVYALSAHIFGGVPKPWFQRNLEELPLTSDLRFVTIAEERPRSTARVMVYPSSQAGFRL